MREWGKKKPKRAINNQYQVEKNIDPTLVGVREVSCIELL